MDLIVKYNKNGVPLRIRSWGTVEMQYRNRSRTPWSLKMDRGEAITEHRYVDTMFFVK